MPFNPSSPVNTAEARAIGYFPDFSPVGLGLGIGIGVGIRIGIGIGLGLGLG